MVSAQLAEEGVERHAVVNKAVQVGHGHTCLGHGVAFAQSHGVILECLVVHSDAEGGADGILAAVALADGILLLVVGVEVELDRKSVV